MIFLYRLYQLLIALPIGLIATIITALLTIIGCTLGNARFWSYYPCHLWAKLMIRIFLLPVKVSGMENIDKGKSYVFTSNHQGAFDIFLVSGFLNVPIKWMMKHELRKIPFVGKACEAAGFIFIDNKSPKNIRESYDKARHILQDGTSVMVFPEGRRTETGEMGVYRRGAFMLADELQLPVVPMTLTGCFHVMPRQKDWHWVNWHPLTLTVHAPISPIGQGNDNIHYLLEESYKATKAPLCH